jgi:hypothetical protein
VRLAASIIASGKAAERDLARNPFNRWSVHHRPVGQVRYGVPPYSLGGIKGPYVGGREFTSPSDLSPFVNAYPDIPKSGNVGAIVCRAGPQGPKYTYEVSPTDPPRTITLTDSGVSHTERFPAWDAIYNRAVVYPGNAGDSNLILCNGDRASLLFNFYNGLNSAKMRREYSLAGTDTADDGQPRGSSASGVRWPGTILRGFEIERGYIGHALNFTATRNSRASNADERASPLAHIINRGRVWPAMFTDGFSVGLPPYEGEPDNQGWLPYGALCVIRHWDAGLRDSLGLTAIGKALFDCLLDYGMYLLDGSGQNGGHPDKGRIEVRVDQGLLATSALALDVEIELGKLLPLLFPVFNQRTHATEVALHTDGLPYTGGGGPRRPQARNTAWDI